MPILKNDVLLWDAIFPGRTIPESTTAYNALFLASQIATITNLPAIDYQAVDPAFQATCEHVVLKFALKDSNFAKVLLSDDELSKANEVYARRQYQSKILQKILSAFQSLLSQPSGIPAPNNLFLIPLLDEWCRVQEEALNKSHKPLKKLIEKIASGVKSNCYREAEKAYLPSCLLDKFLNDFAIAHYHYSLNDTLRYGVKDERTMLPPEYENAENNRILQLALLPDSAFWADHKNFSVITFLNESAKQNDLNHAIKILDCIFKNLQEMENMDHVFRNGFPLYMSLYKEMTEVFEDRAHRRAFDRLQPYCKTSPVENFPLCYPMSNAKGEHFSVGKSVWERFLREYNYPTEAKNVLAYLQGEVDRFVSEKTHAYDDIAVILDSTIFGYTADSPERKFFQSYHPHAFSAENIWKRVYLKCYAVTLLAKDEQTQNAYLQRIFVDLIKEIERRTGICTAHQLDVSTRIEHYEKLKETLGFFDVKVKDTCKEDYIISLLDRDNAFMEEANRFPILEQLGDAIYGLAVAELLFYNPNTKRMAEQFEKYTRAEFQVYLSHENGFDKLYLKTGIPSKYVEYDTLSESGDSFVLNDEYLKDDSLKQEKYLADSLEMIIGAICRDQGIVTALRFAKDLLLKTCPTLFSPEIHLTEQNKQNRKIPPGYWAKILSAPYSAMTQDLNTLGNALTKVILTVSIGTEDKEKRKYITYSFGNTAVFGETNTAGVAWVFHDYLINGLPYVLEKYGDIVRENYRNKNI